MSKKIAAKWLKQALHDLEMAEKNVLFGGYDVAAFLAHQAVEKLFKAIFAIRDLRPPRTHNLDDLAKRLNFDLEIIRLVADITPDYQFARYPDVSNYAPVEYYTEDIAKKKVEVAKTVFRTLASFYQDYVEA